MSDIIMDKLKLTACVVHHALTEERSVEERIDKWMELAENNTVVPANLIPTRSELLGRVGEIVTAARVYNGKPSTYLVLRPGQVVIYLMHEKFANGFTPTDADYHVVEDEADVFRSEGVQYACRNVNTNTYQINSGTNRWSLNNCNLDTGVADVSYGRAHDLKTWAKDCASGDMETFMRSRGIVAGFLANMDELTRQEPELRDLVAGCILPPFLAEIKYPYKYNLPEFIKNELDKNWSLSYESNFADPTRNQQRFEFEFKDCYPEFFGANTESV